MNTATEEELLMDHGPKVLLGIVIAVELSEPHAGFLLERTVAAVAVML